MSDDIIKKYESKENQFIATEEDLESIKSVAVDESKEKTIKPEIADPEIKRGEFKSTEVSINRIDEFEEKQLALPPETADDLKTDYQYVRTNIYTITERSIEALNNLVQIADQSQHPRAYEVVATLVNSIASAQRDLINAHKEKAKIEGNAKKNSPDVVNNNLFVGNTAQLDEIIANMRKKEEDE
jgi:hypothetical protein